MINDIITQFNANVLSVIPNQANYCELFGVAESAYTINDEEIAVPLVYCSGEDYYPFIDDEYKFGLYHRITKKNYTTEKNKGFGNEAKLTCICDCSVIVWGFKKFTDQNNIESILISSLPEEASISSTDFDKKRVFNSEFSKVNFDFISEDVFLFKIDYKVQYVINKSCLEIDKNF